MRRRFILAAWLPWLLLLVGVGPAAAQFSLPDNAPFLLGTNQVTPMGAIYSTAPSAPTDGHIGVPRMDVNRNLQINCLNCAGAAGGTSATDKAGFVAGTSSFTPIGGARDDASTSTLDEDAYGITRMTQFRAIHVNLRDASGNEITSLGGGGLAQGSTTSGQSGSLTQGAVTTSAPTYVTGTTNPLSMQTDGSIRTAVTNTVTVASHAVTNAGTFAVQATQSGTWTVQPGNTANTTAWLVTGTGGTFPATQSGTWSVRLQDGSGNALTSLAAGAQRAITVSVVDSSGNQVSSFGGSGGTASAFGAAFPSGASSGTAAGFNDGTNMQGARVVDCDTGAGSFYCLTVNLVRRVNGTPTEIIGQTTMANSLPVTLASDQSAIAVSQSGTWNIGTVSTVSAVTAITNALPAGTNVIGVVGVGQGSTTAGQSGPLMQGAVATSAPTYTTAQTSPLSLQTDGALRTAVTNTVTVASHAVTNAGTFAVQATQAGTWSTRTQDGSGNNLTSKAAGSERAITVAVVDGSGNQVTSFGGAGGTASNFGSAFPSAGTAVGFTDGSNMRGATVFDADSGAGTQYVLGVNLRLASSGGSVEVSQTNPIAVRFSDGTSFLAAGAVDTDDGTVAGGQANVSLVISQNYNWDGSNWVRRQQIANGTNSTGTGIPMAGLVSQFDDSSPTSCTENQFCNVRITALRALHNSIRDAAGNDRGANVNSSNELLVALSSVPSHAVTNAGTFAVQSASSGSTAHDAAGSAVNPVAIGGYASAAAPTDVSTDTDIVRAWHRRDGAYVMQAVPGIANGVSVSRTVAAGSTNAANVKASAGQVYALAITNEATTLRWVHLYNTSGTPTCNSSIIASFGIPGATAGAGNNFQIPVGVAFSSGIGICITTTRDGTGSVTANDVTLNVLYK